MKRQESIAIWKRPFGSKPKKTKAFRDDKTAECQRLKAQIAEDRLQVAQTQTLAETICELETDLEKLEQLQSELEQVTAKGQSCKHLSQKFGQKMAALQESHTELREKTRKMQNHAEDHCPLCERLLSQDDVALLLNKYQLELEKSNQVQQTLERERSEIEHWRRIVAKILCV